MLYIYSVNPDLAGHPSDVIIGGGVDIMVGEATKGINVVILKFSTNVVCKIKNFCYL